MIVQDHPDGCLFGIVTVQGFQMFDELSAAMAVRHHFFSLRLRVSASPRENKVFVLFPLRLLRDCNLFLYFPSEFERV